MTRLVRYPKAREADATIRRFEPAYWQLDFNLDMMATVITTGPNAMRVKALFRTNTDLAGLIWKVEDDTDHALFAYPRRKDYRGCVLEFDWASSGIRSMERLQSVTLTVDTYAGVTHFIRLWNYKISGTPDACRIRIVFDDSTKSGYYSDAPVPWNDVRRMFISLQPAAAGRGNCTLAAAAAQGAPTLSINVGDAGTIAPGDTIFLLGSDKETPFYTATSTTSGAVQNVAITPPLNLSGPGTLAAGSEIFVQKKLPDQIGESPAQIDISNISVTGANSTLPIRTAHLPHHLLRMTDGYDNAYPMTPERIVEQVYRLGYRDFYVLYMGISKLHSMSWNAGEGRYIVDPAKPKLNAPTVQFLTDLFARLHDKGFRIIVSVSFEILARFVPTAWRQLDYAGNPSQTGWTPPSSLVAPTHPAALAYLADLFLACLALVPAGAEKHFQVGEPWWWDGSFGTNAPHIYDPVTMAAYTAETGQPVPTPRLTTIYGQPAAQHLPYLEWCRDQLGDATAYLVNAVKAVHATAKSYLLIFTPQLLNDAAPMLRTLNFPQAAWSAPAFDVLQIEDYDWVVEGHWYKLPMTWVLAMETLGYPLDRIHYFAGFNLRRETTWIWANTDYALFLAQERTPQETYIWSREQVMRDGWAFDRSDWPIFGELSKLATCWRIERTDGVVLGFTSHDQPLTIGGVEYDPAGGFDASSLASDTEMSAGDVEVIGALDSDFITAEALLAGVYDKAAVEMFVVDWGDLTLPKRVLRRGWIGEIAQSGGNFRTELRGLGQKLQGPLLEAFSPECRADLGDSRCKVNLEALKVAGTVTAVTDGSLGAARDNRIFFAAGLNQPDGWFTYGTVRWTGGRNDGRSAEIRSYAAGRVELWEPMGFDIAAGDAFLIYPGCDKRAETCSGKFGNIVNMRAEPHVPGLDSMFRYPDAKA